MTDDVGAWDRASSHNAPYQWLLRAIGAFLDREGAAHIQIMEIGDGFAVRYERAGDASDLRLQHVGFDELLQVKARMEADRTGRRESGEQTGRYQDFLRALGYDLEQASAYFILLDEVDDDFLITYQYLRPSESYLPHKHLSVINRDAREDLLQRAHSRRIASERRSRFGLLDRK
jgi:hypothetical protein